MAYVIAEPCIGTKDTACVDACPVDCIHPRRIRTMAFGQHSTAFPQLYIDPVVLVDDAAPILAVYRSPGMHQVFDEPDELALTTEDRELLRKLGIGSNPQ